MTDNSNDALLQPIRDEMRPLFDRIEREALHIRLQEGRAPQGFFAAAWLHDLAAAHEIDAEHGDCRFCGATRENLDDALFAACSRRWENVPTRFAIEQMRRIPVEAPYFDNLEKHVHGFCHFMLDTLRSDPANADLAQIELAAYRNPMRDDGVFVAEKKEIEPYGNYADARRHLKLPDGSPVYPPPPRTPHKFPQQLPHEFARRIIACWNACRGTSTEELENYGKFLGQMGFGER